jgi:hypothetical protein
MLKKTIKYVDYNDEEREEDFYFNLTKAELTQMQLSEKGGLDAVLDRMLQTRDEPSMIKMFKEIIDLSYGVKSTDGRRFIKNQEVLDDFRQTEAYSVLFMELATNSEAAAEFINGIVPKEVASGLAETIKQ